MRQTLTKRENSPGKQLCRSSEKKQQKNQSALNDCKTQNRGVSWRMLCERQKKLSFKETFSKAL
jgi:hypothetical protein